MSENETKFGQEITFWKQSLLSCESLKIQKNKCFLFSQEMIYLYDESNSGVEKCNDTVRRTPNGIYFGNEMF